MTRPAGVQHPFRKNKLTATNSHGSSSCGGVAASESSVLNAAVAADSSVASDKLSGGPSVGTDSNAAFDDLRAYVKQVDRKSNLKL